MLTEKQINALPERVYQLFKEVNTFYLEKAGETIKRIGTMTQSEARMFLQLHKYGADITQIKRELAKAVKKSNADIDEIFEIVGHDAYRDAKIFYDAQNAEYIPLQDNKPLNSIINRYADQVKEQLFGIAQTTAFAYFDRGLNDFSLSDLSTAYQKIVEQGVLAVNMGVTDYQSAMRRVIKQMADNGIKTINYATGYSRRLDTAVRQNILWGVKQCNQSLQHEMGRQFNYDGVEVSYHSNPRPSHTPMGGKQFALGKNKAVVKGKVYPAFEAPYAGEKAPKELLEEYNCYHFTFPIILGISEPNWSPEELLEMKKKDSQAFEYQGVKYNGYQASQVQRKLEAAIRNEKDRQIAFKASGDDVQRRISQSRINDLQKQYRDFSQVSGLSEKQTRKSVAGYSGVTPLSDDHIDFYNKNLSKSPDDLLPEHLTAEIPSSKLSGYALNADHEVGKDKAVAFRKYLGYTDKNEADLITELHKGLKTFKATPRKSTEYGTPYEVAMLLRGANGKYAKVKSGWIIDNGKDTPRLTSVYVDE